MAVLVNGELVDDGPFLEAFRQLGGSSTQFPDQNNTLRQLAERRVVGGVLLRQMARASGMAVSTKEIAELRASRWGTSSASVCGVAVHRQLADDLLVERFCQWLTRHEPRPSRVDVERYYLQHHTEFHLPERIRVAQIIGNVDAPAEEAPVHLRLQQAEQELDGGAAFAKVAERYSDCGGKAILGWVARGSMVPEFERTVFGLGAGARSGIFRTVFGFHIALVMERKPEGFQSLQDLRPTLARRMHMERRQRVIDTAIEQALRTSVIEPAPAKAAPAIGYHP